MGGKKVEQREAERSRDQSDLKKKSIPFQGKESPRERRRKTNVTGKKRCARNQCRMRRVRCYGG